MCLCVCVRERERDCVCVCGGREGERNKGASKFVECLFVVLRKESECESKCKCKLSWRCQDISWI